MECECIIPMVVSPQLLLIQLQDAHERLLRNLYIANLAHPLLAFLLLLQKLFLT